MHSQLSQATLRIREMILRGELAPGERVAEARLADLLGMSRTPVRQALPLLEREGLLVRQATRGYVVRGFTQADISEALDVRAVLEGLAARRLAEQGASEQTLCALRECLAEGDEILDCTSVDRGTAVRYAEMNARFHQLIVDAGAGHVLAEALANNSRIPFAGAQAVAFDQAKPRQVLAMLQYAHRQHHGIVECIERRQAARVEALMREHAMAVMDSIGLPGREIEQVVASAATPHA